MRDLILLGGGGHCISCIDAIEETRQHRIIGILDLPHRLGETILGYTITGTDNEMGQYIGNEVDFMVTVGQVTAGHTLRKSIFENGLSLGANFPSICSPGARISKYAVIHKGVIALAGSLINAEAVVGDNCIINSGAIVEHGAIIGANTHLSTSSVVNGDCQIGENCLIGSGAIIRNGTTIVDDTLIGMGAVITKNITKPGIYFGNPARKIG